MDSRLLSPTKILIKGGTVVNAHHKEVADVYIEDGVIVSVRPNIKVGVLRNEYECQDQSY